MYEMNDGHCREYANTPEYGYDGGDCCPCTCSGGSDSCWVFSCLDPHAPADFYDCEDPPLAGPICDAENQRNWVVGNTSDVQALSEALNCSGGYFQVTWVGHVVISETIYVVNGSTLNITGSGDVATFAGGSKTKLFTVVNAFLYFNDIDVTEGNATSGGAIGASASTLTFRNVNFIANTASAYGGALFLSGGSNVTFDGPSEFIDNSASYGGALFLSGGSNVNFNGTSEFMDNSAVFGGAFFVEGSSKVSWLATATLSRNTATVKGGAVFSLVKAAGSGLTS